MQAKFHRWAADLGRRFGDLLSFVHDPATLIVALSLAVLFGAAATVALLVPSIHRDPLATASGEPAGSCRPCRRRFLSALD
jgi:hypothetical protein